MNSIRERLDAHPYLTLLTLAFAVRLAAFFFQLPELDKPLIKDALIYRELADGLIDGRGYVLDNRPTAIVTPLYPVFLAAVLKLTGGGVKTVVLIQEFLSALSVLLIFRVGTSVGGGRLAWVAGIAAAFYWPFAMAATRMLSETLFIALLLAGGLFLLEFTRGGRFRDAALAGAFFGLACLTRGVLMYFVVPAGFWLFMRTGKDNLQKAGIAAVLFVGAFALMMSPWVVRNRLVLGACLPGGSNTGMVIYTGNFPENDRMFGMNLRAHQLPPGKRYILDLPELERDRALKALAFERMKQDPVHVARMTVTKALFFWVPVDWEILGRGGGTFNPWFFWVAVFALIWLGREKKWRDWLVPLALVAYFFLISLAAYGSPRLRMPVEPFVILAAAGGWLVFERQVVSLPARAAVLAAVLISGVYGYVWGDQLKEFAAGAMSAIGLW